MKSKEVVGIQRRRMAADDGGGTGRGCWERAATPAPTVEAGGVMNKQRRGGFVMAMVVTMIGTYQEKYR